MWRILVLVLFLGLAGCAKPEKVSFRNTDITGAEMGLSLAGLKDHHGQARALASFRGKAVLLFFGYTSCPDVCPTTLSRLAGVMKQLGANASRVQVLMVTVDPERDTPERLATYMTGFDASFIGLSGDAAATEAVAQDLKVFFAKPAGDHHHESDESDKAAYAIGHSTGIYVFDPAGKIRLYLKNDAPDDAIVSDLNHLLVSG